MLYALYFFSSVVLSFFTVRLTGKVLGYEVTKNRFLFWFCMAAIAGDSLLLTLPAELFYVPVRMVILLVVMLMNSLVYSLLFRKFELKMLYLSLLTFVTNANYTTILQMFISERIYYKIVACYLETAVIILLLVLIRKKKKYGVIITESINLIPPSALCSDTYFPLSYEPLRVYLDKDRFRTLCKVPDIPRGSDDILHNRKDNADKHSRA